jgi:acyl-coenzyme A synthetase/AMP-(fatty) acid ligase
VSAAGLDAGATVLLDAGRPTTSAPVPVLDRMDPAELEALLPTHPGIIDAAVIGVTDTGGEEIPKAFVVAGDSTLTAEQVREFVAAIPKSSAGKILRGQLRAGQVR